MLDNGGAGATSQWQRAQRVLCVRLDTIGDVLMTGPAICAIRSSRADRTITLLTSSAGAAAGRLLPDVDDVIVYDTPWMKPSPDVRSEQEMADLLRVREFDAAVIFTTYTQSALPGAMLCRMAGVPLRLAHSRENPYALLTDWVRESDAPELIRHEVRRQLDLVGTVGCSTADESLSITVPPEAQLRAQTLLREHGFERDAPWCIVHPGASAASRRYAPESFAAAADELARDGWRIVLTGGAAERALTESVASMMRTPAVSLAGVLDLGELAALIALAPVLICNNSGPAHIAAAVGTPVVVLYALTNPQHTPWGVPSRVLSRDVPCRWCYRSVCLEGHHNCLRLIAPAEVAAAARELAVIERKETTAAAR